MFGKNKTNKPSNGEKVNENNQEQKAPIGTVDFTENKSTEEVPVPYQPGAESLNRKKGSNGIYKDPETGEEHGATVIKTNEDGTLDLLVDYPDGPLRVHGVKNF